ncbi:MAG: diaminopimelate decarboxylase [Alphaproteobacteria bacterium RIFOXYD12_FULL_60_8]|nr:MAG: diaminopimelate decarboxylase [Alphaproteobacteria bacterium RIFOXYD12_FULL_60_8]
MDHFHYLKGALHAEQVSLSRIAEAVGTPFYCYSTATLERHFTVFADAFAGLDVLVCFAAKANSNVAVLRTLADLGAGADVVSEGELRLALKAGIPPERIVFSGVGKTEWELELALQLGIHQINVESVPELETLDRLARHLGVKAPVAIRVNPDVDAHTHEKISTGLKENKFGIEWTIAHDVFRTAHRMEGISLKGCAVHIGSQVTELEPFETAFLRVRDLVSMLRADGIPVERLDLGGGLGIPYERGHEPPPLPSAYAEVVRRTVGDLGCRLIFEPGRLIVGNGGVLVSRVLRIKEGATRTFVVVDAGMNDLVRPAIYDAYHEIIPVAEPAADAAKTPMDVVGPICETGDTFAKQRPLPPLKAGDLVVFATAGAYGSSMASTYNARPLIPEVMVRGADYALVRRRPTFEEMLALETLPDWFAAK